MQANKLYSGLSEIAGIYDSLNGNPLDGFNKTELDTEGFKIPDKIINEFKIKMKKFTIKPKSFSPKINSEKDFRDYAHAVMKKAHGDSYDVDTTNKVVDDLIKDNPDADYGELIGRLTSGFGDKSFADNESVVKCVTTNPTQLLKILNAIKEHGNIGHSFEVIVDAGDENEEKFSWDGDGADRIESIETDGAKLYSSSEVKTKDGLTPKQVVSANKSQCDNLVKRFYKEYKSLNEGVALTELDECYYECKNDFVRIDSKDARRKDLLFELASRMVAIEMVDKNAVRSHSKTFSGESDREYYKRMAKLYKEEHQKLDKNDPDNKLKIARDDARLDWLKAKADIEQFKEDCDFKLAELEAKEEKLYEKFVNLGPRGPKKKKFSEVGAVVLKNPDGTYEVVSIQDERDEDRIREYRDKEGCKVVKRCDSTREADDYIEEHGFERAYSSTKEFGIKDNIKKWTVESLAELAYGVIEDNKLIQEAFKGYKGNSADDLKNFMNQYRIGVVDALATLAVIFEFGLKDDQKNYSELTVDNDPSILNQEKSNLDSKSLTTKREGMNMNWSVQNPFNLSVEPWLVANVINGKADGLYVGSLLGDSIDLGSDHISLDIKLGNSQPTDVFVIVREGKAIIFKASQLSKKSKSFSAGNYDYRFSIVPTEVSYEMQYLIGSWMMAASICHLYHICDNKYAGHVALDEFYKEFPEKVDALAEHFLADNEKAEFRVCVIPGECPIDYLTRLLQFTLKYVDLNEGKIPSSYQSQIDEIVCFTQSILYKLKRLDSGRRIFSIKSFSNLMGRDLNDTYKFLKSIGFSELTKSDRLGLAGVEDIDGSHKAMIVHLGEGSIIFDKTGLSLIHYVGPYLHFDMDAVAKAVKSSDMLP